MGEDNRTNANALGMLGLSAATAAIHRVRYLYRLDLRHDQLAPEKLRPSAVIYLSSFVSG